MRDIRCKHCGMAPLDGEPCCGKRKPTLREKADAWMDANVVAMDVFRTSSREMLDRNRRFGMKLLAEHVRWEMNKVTTRVDDDDFKINNNYVAYIGRRLCAEEPRLVDLIRCRVTPAADRPAKKTVLAQEVDPLSGVVKQPKEESRD